MQDNEKYQVLATKVSTEVWVRINRLARKKGLTIYELVQMTIDTLVRYMDDRHNLTPDMEKAMAIFEHMEGWRDALNMADPSVEKVVGEAIYFLFDAEGKKKGCRAVHVVKPFFDNWTEDTNLQHIAERAICLLMPERYRRLRMLAVDAGCHSLLEYIDHLIDYHSREADVAAMRQEFEDADRSDWGIKPADQPYRRRHNHMTMDLFEQHEAQQEIERERAEQLKWLAEHPDEDPFTNEN